MVFVANSSFHVTAGEISRSTLAKGRKLFLTTGKRRRPKQTTKENKNEKISCYIRYDSAGAWVPCAFAGGKGRPANCGFMA
jgi:hypothetical protein